MTSDNIYAEKLAAVKKAANEFTKNLTAEAKKQLRRDYPRYLDKVDSTKKLDEKSVPNDKPERSEQQQFEQTHARSESIPINTDEYLEKFVNPKKRRRAFDMDFEYFTEMNRLGLSGKELALAQFIYSQSLAARGLHVVKRNSEYLSRDGGKYVFVGKLSEKEILEKIACHKRTFKEALEKLGTVGMVRLIKQVTEKTLGGSEDFYFIEFETDIRKWDTAIKRHGGKRAGAGRKRT
jgi:hypothetical protein